MVTAIATQLMSEGFGGAGKTDDALGLDCLRVAGAERLSPGEVVREVAAAMSVTPKELADGVATARGARAIRRPTRRPSRRWASASRSASRWPS